MLEFCKQITRKAIHCLDTWTPWPWMYDDQKLRCDQITADRWSLIVSDMWPNLWWVDSGHKPMSQCHQWVVVSCPASVGDLCWSRVSISELSWLSALITKHYHQLNTQLINNDQQQIMFEFEDGPNPPHTGCTKKLPCSDWFQLGENIFGTPSK